MTRPQSGGGEGDGFGWALLGAGVGGLLASKELEQKHQQSIERLTLQANANYFAWQNVSSALEQKTAHCELLETLLKGKRLEAAGWQLVSKQREEALAKAQQKIEELQREIAAREAFDAGAQLNIDPPGDFDDYPMSKN